MSSQNKQAQITEQATESSIADPKNELAKADTDANMEGTDGMYSKPTGDDFRGGKPEFHENAMDTDGGSDRSDNDDDDDDDDDDDKDRFERKLLQFKGDITGFVQDQTTTAEIPPDILTLWEPAYEIVKTFWERKRTNKDKQELEKINDSIKESNKDAGRRKNLYQFPWKQMATSIEESAKLLKDIQGLSEKAREAKSKDLLNHYAIASKQFQRDGIDLRRTLTPQLQKVLDRAKQIHKNGLEQGHMRNLFISLPPSHLEVLRYAKPTIESFFDTIEEEKYSEVPKILKEIRKQSRKLDHLNKALKSGSDSWSLPIRQFEELWTECKSLDHVRESLQSTKNENNDSDPDVGSADEADEELESVQEIPHGTNMIHPGWKSGITPYGQVKFVRFAGRGSYRVFLNAGTDQTPYFIVRNGSDFPRGCAEEWFEEFKSESNQSKNWRPETFEALDIIQSEPSPWSTTNRAPPAYFYGLENGIPTIWTKSEAITRCGKKTTQMAMTLRLRKRAERHALLEQSKSRGVHPDTKKPLIESAKEETPWLLASSLSLLTLEERPSKGGRVTKLIDSDAGEEISRKALMTQRRAFNGRDGDMVETLANLQATLDKFEAFMKSMENGRAGRR